MKIKIIVKFKDGDVFEQAVKLNGPVNVIDYVYKTFSEQFLMLYDGENKGFLVKQEEIRYIYWEILAEE